MVNIIKEIKKNVKEGETAVEEIIEEVEDAAEKIEEKIEKSLDKKAIEEETKKEFKIAAEAESLDTSETDKIKEKEKGKSLEERKKELLKNSEIKISDSQKAKELEDKKRKLLEKVKKISKKIDVTKTEELKEKVRIKKKSDMLIPLDEYVKAGIYLGTKAVTPNMKPFVYRRRADGLAIFNTDLIDEKLKEGVNYMVKFDAKEIILVCKRKAGWKAAEMFSELTGIRIFTKKYPAGILTNVQLPDFFENELTIITDSWLDKNALNDTLKIKKKVLMICDTNNFSKGADQIIIGNNKSVKSLGVIFYLLTKGFCKAKGIEADIPDLEWWVSEGE